MKLFHISDLHIGRLLHRYSLEEQQHEILEKIRAAASAEKPHAILIAGDVYDRSLPSVWATQALDHFLTGLLALKIPVLMISGNHDSAERLGFLAGPLKHSGLYISPAYRGETAPVTLRDDDGSEVDFWLLPFLRPASVRPFHPQESITCTNDAVACAIRSMPIDPDRRNVLIAHQFVSGARLSGSEESFELVNADEISVGGTDLVDVSLFAPFDYTALGHLHRAQNVGSERVRYSGTPMAYSFSEIHDEKSITVVELGSDRQISLHTIPLPPPRRLQELRGSFAQITSPDAVYNTDRDAFTHIILTDDMPIPDVINKLRQYYPNITHLDWDNERMRRTVDFELPADAKKHTPLSLFSEFFEHSAGAAMSDEQLRYVDDLIRSIWEEEA